MQHINTDIAADPRRELKLRSCRAELVTLAGDFAELNKCEKAVAGFIPDAGKKLDALKRTITFSSPRETILEKLELELRLALAVEAENTNRRERAGLETRLRIAFANATELLEPPQKNRSPKNRFSNPGGSPEGKIPDAIAAIDAALK